jgi:hypothetical protein
MLLDPTSRLGENDIYLTQLGPRNPNLPGLEITRAADIDA